MGLSVAAVVLAAGSLSTHAIVVDQAGRGPGGILPNWNVITLGGIPFFIYLVAATAEINRPPFDLVEAEQELVGGFFTEYSSVRFALFYLAEFMNTITVSAVAVTLFFGGPSGPVYSFLPDTLWPILWFFLKLLVFLFGYVWLRGERPPLPLRPAHGPGLEAPHPRRALLAAADRGHPDRARPGLERQRSCWASASPRAWR